MARQSPSKYSQSRGNHIIQQLFNRNGEPRDERRSGKKADTYRQMKQLREMLKGGQITGEEYEAIKFELLNR